MDDYVCEKCGFDMNRIAENPDSWGKEGSNKPIQIKSGSYRSFYDGSFSGHRWLDILICPKCGNRWEVRNSDI